MSRRRVDTRRSLGPDDEVMPYSDDETDDELEEESSEGEEEAPERAPQPQVETRPTGELFKTCNDPFFFFFFPPLQGMNVSFYTQFSCFITISISPKVLIRF